MEYVVKETAFLWLLAPLRVRMCFCCSTCHEESSSAPGGDDLVNSADLNRVGFFEMVLRAPATETMIFPLTAALLCVFTRCSHHTSCSPLSLSYKGENKSAVNLCSAPLEMESCLSILTRSREQSCTYMLS